MRDERRAGDDGRGDGLYGRLARGASTAFSLQVAGTAAAYLSQVFLARWLGVEAYGRFAYVHSWSLLLAVLAGLGLPPAALRFLPEYAAAGDGRSYRGFLRSARLTSLALSLLLAIAIVVLADRGLLGAYSSAWLVGAWLVPVVAFLNLHMQVARCAGRIALALAPQHLLKHVGLLTGAGLVLYYFHGVLLAEQAVAVLLGALAILALLQAGILQRSLPGLPEGEGGGFRPRAWLAVSLPLLLILVFQYLLTQADVLMVGALLGDRAVGIYNAASRSAAAVGFAFFAVNAVAAPVIADHYARRDRAGLRRLVRRTTRWIFWPALTIAVLLAFFGRIVLGLFGQDFVVAHDEMLILGAGYVLAAAMGLSINLLNLTGHQGSSAWIFGGATVLNLVLNAVLIPWLDIRGAALATAISMATWNVALVFTVRRKLGFSPFILAGAAREREGHEDP